MSLVLAAGGVLTVSPALLVAAAVAAVVGGLARVAAPPAVELRLRRTVSDPDPDPGDEIEVTVTVENVGGHALADLRLADGVPAGAIVTEGAASRAVALRPGARTALRYELRVGSGEHRFRPALAVARDPTGSVERRVRVRAETATTLTARPASEPLPALPLQRRAARAVGEVPAEVGEGVTFHSTREYRRGDPVSRIDWHRRARTGDLATVQYRAERAAAVVVAVDVRQSAAVAPEPDAETAIDRSRRAADRIVETLLEAGNRAGLATVGGSTWISPGAGRSHRRRLSDALLDAGADPPPGDATDTVSADALLARLPRGAQVVLCSPCCEEGVVDFVERLRARGVPVTVLSPDPTGDERPGERFAALERRERLTALRRAGARTLDWDRETPLAAAVETAGWSP